MFFPFDPYLLRRSAAWLDLGRTYLRWRGGQPHAVDELEDADNADLLVPEGLEADEADLEGLFPAVQPHNSERVWSATDGIARCLDCCACNDRICNC